MHLCICCVLLVLDRVQVLVGCQKPAPDPKIFLRGAMIAPHRSCAVSVQRDRVGCEWRCRGRRVVLAIARYDQAANRLFVEDSALPSTTEFTSTSPSPLLSQPTHNNASYVPFASHLFPRAILGGGWQSGVREKSLLHDVQCQIRLRSCHCNATSAFSIVSGQCEESIMCCL